MLDKAPIHPFMLGIFPVICVFTSLMDYLLPEELILPLAVSFALTISIFAVAFLLIRNLQKAAIIASASILLNIPFDIMSLALDKVTVPLNWISDDRIYLIPYLIFAGLLIFILATAKSEFKILTSFLNVVGLVLVVGNVGYIIVHEVIVGNAVAEVSRRQEKIALKDRQDKPDIYYVILDAMARTDTLKEFYDYDNSSFIQEIEKRGFVVPARSKSNYQMTGLSLPASLNMEYINYLSEILGKQSRDHAVPYRLIQRNRLAEALHGVGYKFVSVRSGYSPTAYIPEADVNLGFPLGNIFHLAFLRSTLAGPFLLEPLTQAARLVRSYGISHAEEIMSEPSPKFVFVHMECPHPPFIFKENGEEVIADRISLSEVYTKDKYVDQVKFVQSKVLSFVDHLDRNPAKKVIILQADHGPSIQLGADGNPSASYLKERMRIFNAYKLPGAEDGTIYDGITPVNTFRVVLNKYFDAGLPLLADECYYSPSGRPYRFTKVTELVTP